MKTVFVSSTFRDMQAERDILHLDVLPVLQEKAKENCDNIDLIDLRWGVNTGEMEEEEANHKVLSICLDNIDRAKPYMLILLGERYGWMPPKKLLDHAAMEKGYKRRFDSESVTALEIEYGALTQEDLSHCVVCMREPFLENELDEESARDYKEESLEHHRKLKQIKKELRERIGERLITYRASWDAERKRPCGLEGFAQQVTQQFLELFAHTWVGMKQRNWQDQEYRDVQHAFAQKRKRFAARKALLDGYMKDICASDAGLFILRGEAGSGKSSILAMLEERLPEAGIVCAPFIGGNSERSSTAEDFLQQVIYFFSMANNKKIPPPQNRQDAFTEKAIAVSPRQWCDYLSKLCEQYETENFPPVIFILDGLDQLTPSDTLDNFGFLPDKIGGKIRFLLSCREDYRIPTLPAIYKSCEWTVPLLESKQEMREVLGGILAHAHKGLDEVVWQALLEKPGMNNPLYGGMLLWRLMIMDADDLSMAKSGEALNEKMIEIVQNSPDALYPLSCMVLTEAAERIRSGFSQTVLSLLAVSRHGMSAEALEALLTQLGIPWSNLDFLRLMRYLSAYLFWREDGRIDFTHRAIREGFLGSLDNSSQLHSELASYISALPHGNRFRSGEGVHHANLSNNGKLLLQLMSDARESTASTSDDNASMLITRGLLELFDSGDGVWVSEVFEKCKAEPTMCKAAYLLMDLFSQETLHLTGQQAMRGLTAVFAAYTAACSNSRAGIRGNETDEEWELLLPTLTQYIGCGFMNYGNCESARPHLMESMDTFDRRYAKNRTSKNRSAYVVSVYYLAKLYAEADHYEVAYELMHEIDKLWDDAVKENDTVMAIERAGFAKLLYAKCCCTLERGESKGISESQDAVCILQILFNIADNAGSLKGLVQAQELFSTALWKQGYHADWCEQQEKLFLNLEKLCQYEPDIQYVMLLASMYEERANRLSEIKGYVALARCMKRCSDLYKTIFNFVPTIQNLSKMATTCYLAAFCTQQIDDLAQAEHCIEAAVSAAETLYQQTGEYEEAERLERYSDLRDEILEKIREASKKTTNEGE